MKNKDTSRQVPAASGDAGIRLSGYYINLDESRDRRAQLENNLAQIGAQRLFRRFSARRGDDRPGSLSRSELGCLLSHQAILDAAPVDRYMLVIEDDARLPANFSGYLLSMLEKAPSDWDLLFLSHTENFRNITRMHQLIRLKREIGPIHEPDFGRFMLLDGATWYTYGAVAYVIAPGAGPRISAMINAMCANGHDLPIDQLFARLIRGRQVSARILFPYIVGVDPGFESTMPDRRGSQMADLYCATVNMFVAGGDSQALKDEARRIFSDPDIDDDAFIASQIAYRAMARS